MSITGFTIRMFTVEFMFSGSFTFISYALYVFSVCAYINHVPHWYACFIGISAKATDAYESARTKVANFVNAANSREIVFTRNATEAINLVAYSWGMSNLKQGDEVSPLFLTSWLICVLGWLYQLL